MCNRHLTHVTDIRYATDTRCATDTRQCHRHPMCHRHPTVPQTPDMSQTSNMPQTSDVSQTSRFLFPVPCSRPGRLATGQAGQTGPARPRQSPPGPARPGQAWPGQAKPGQSWAGLARPGHYCIGFYEGPFRVPVWEPEEMRKRHTILNMFFYAKAYDMAKYEHSCVRCSLLSVHERGPQA